MSNKLLGIGAFLIAVGAITLVLGFSTDVKMFDPLFPPILCLVVGCASLVGGILTRP